MDAQILDWDSKLFGFDVARVQYVPSDAEQLLDILQTLKAAKVQLVYLCADREEDSFERLPFRTFGPVCNVTYQVKLKEVHSPQGAASGSIASYSESMGFNNMRNLSVIAGKYSRFSVDPDVPDVVFQSLYDRWIERSLKKDIAIDSLVARHHGVLAGMITLGVEGGQGNIGLLAVDSHFRGKGFGTQLVRAACDRFVSEGYELCSVRTQRNNVAACRLYEKVGFTLQDSQCICHIWLNK